MSRKEQIVYTPNVEEFPTPDFPKNCGKEIEQTLTRSAYPILQEFHSESFYGYPSTSAAQLFGALRYKRYPERYTKDMLETVVHHTFVRCGLQQSGDNRNTVRGNASKSTPLSKRAKQYALPKWTFAAEALSYLHNVANTVEREIAAERKAIAAATAEKEQQS